MPLHSRKGLRRLASFVGAFNTWFAANRAQLAAQKVVPSEALTAEQLRRQHEERWGWRRPQTPTLAAGPHDPEVSAGCRDLYRASEQRVCIACLLNHR